MKTILKYLSFSFFLNICLTVQAEENLYQNEMQQSTVKIICLNNNKGSSGSAFVINPFYLVSNWHVVNCTDKGGKAAVILSQDNIIEVEKVIWKSTIKDLAILKLAHSIPRPAVTLLPSQFVTAGEKVYAAGFPGEADSHIQAQDKLRASTTTGIISKIVQDTDNIHLYQVSAQINPGNSGGPLFNNQNEVIGVNSRKALTRVVTIGNNAQPEVSRVPIGEGIGWAIQIDELLSALEAHQIDYQQSRHTFLTPLWQTWQREPLLMSLLIVVILLSIILLFRRPRQQVVEALTQYIRQPSHNKWQLKISGQAPIFLSSYQLQSNSGLVLGRSQNICDQVIAESSLSGRHCRLQLMDQQLWIEDLNSSNGTLLNGQPLKPYEGVKIQSGDQLILADLTMEISQ